MRLAAGRQPATLVGDVDQHPIADPAGRHPDHRIGGIAQRVVDDVGQDAFQQTGVGHRHGGADLDLDLLQAAAAEDAAALADPDQRALHHLLQVDLGQLGPYHPGRQP